MMNKIISIFVLSIIVCSCSSRHEARVEMMKKFKEETQKEQEQAKKQFDENSKAMKSQYDDLVDQQRNKFDSISKVNKAKIDSLKLSFE